MVSRQAACGHATGDERPGRGHAVGAGGRAGHPQAGVVGGQAGEFWREPAPCTAPRAHLRGRRWQGRPWPGAQQKHRGGTAWQGRQASHLGRVPSPAAAAPAARASTARGWWRRGGGAWGQQVRVRTAPCCVTNGVRPTPPPGPARPRAAPLPRPRGAPGRREIRGVAGRGARAPGGTVQGWNRPMLRHQRGASHATPGPARARAAPRPGPRGAPGRREIQGAAGRGAGAPGGRPGRLGGRARGEWRGARGPGRTRRRAAGGAGGAAGGAARRGVGGAGAGAGGPGGRGRRGRSGLRRWRLRRAGATATRRLRRVWPPGPGFAGASVLEGPPQYCPPPAAPAPESGARTRARRISCKANRSTEAGASVLRYITLMGGSHHLISQAGWNRCDLSIYLAIYLAIYLSSGILVPMWHLKTNAAQKWHLKTNIGGGGGGGGRCHMWSPETNSCGA